MERQEFFTPPKHVGFKAKKLFENGGQIADVAIAYMEPNGGGPTQLHTHPHDHLFIVVQGEAKILLDEKIVTIKKDESFLVDGSVPHSVWNNADTQTVMIGITVTKQ